MKIIIAPNSFKESLSAAEVATAIKEGFAHIFPRAEYICLPLADGGEGTTAALVNACQGKWVELEVEDPLGRTITTQYGLLPNGTAVMEMAAASGLHLLQPSERNPLLTSSYGTGQMIAHATLNGAKHIIIGIGGSATNDGGAGMLEALGIRFLDKNGQPLPKGGKALAQLAQIDVSGSLKTLINIPPITVACDVNNPLTGTQGASIVFGPQKGATPEMVIQLEHALKHYAQIVQQTGFPDTQHLAGSGAAGGLGFSLRTFLNATIQSGIDLVLQTTQLSQYLPNTDLIITGEGKMDEQTLFGKVPMGVLKLAKSHQIPIIGIAGSVGTQTQLLRQHGFSAIFPSIPNIATPAEIFAQTKENLTRTATQIAAIWQLGQQSSKI